MAYGNQKIKSRFLLIVVGKFLGITKKNLIVVRVERDTTSKFRSAESDCDVGYSIASSFTPLIYICLT